MPITGVDVSDFQPNVDWHAVKSSGRSFAFAKATEGLSFVAHSFVENWHGIKAAGLIRGAYHFGRPGTDAKAQAQHFWATVSTQGYGKGDLPLALDLEVNDGVGAAALAQWARTFCAELKRLSGRTPLVYVGAYFWPRGEAIPPGSPLWLPSYFAGTPEYLFAHGKPALPSGWSHWTFWQHSSTAHVPGVSGNCDQSLYAGSLASLRKLAGIGAIRHARMALVDRLKRAGFGSKSAAQVVAALRAWDGKTTGAPRPNDSSLFRRLKKAGLGSKSARAIIYSLRASAGRKGK